MRHYFVQAGRFLLLLMAALAATGGARAETGYDGWLRYAPIDDSAVRARYASFPAAVVAVTDSDVVRSAQQELVRGIRSMLGVVPRAETGVPTESAILLATFADVAKVVPDIGDLPNLADDGYFLKAVEVGGVPHLLIAAPNDRGVLYGAFAVLQKVALYEPIDALHEQHAPFAPIRILNHWENLDGSIERGYAGRSIFWEADQLTDNLERVEDYARLMASVGINGCSINNVNADVRVITPEYLTQVARIAEIFRRWGVRTYISLDFAAPRKIGGIDTFDPLDPSALEFWKNKIDEIYEVIPDLGGFVLKADSEGRLGPSEYGRTHADAANAIAVPLKEHGGLLFYRGFVYDHRMDWRDMSLDRARAAHENFHHLDGKFEDNVVIQIKNGPIDFQVREPPSSLFGALESTNQAIELQITQEYLGQQRHVVFAVPMWKEVLDFDMHAKDDGTPVKQLVAGKPFDRPTGGFVGVSNIGRDTNWLGHHLAMANLYGFGRLAWDPDLSSKAIAEEWTRLTFGHDPRVVGTIVDIQLKSWPTYEDYTGFLGVGGLTDIIHIHFGPGIESSEYNGWGQWHRASDTGIGMNRTVATGTGYIGQYRPPVAQRFESLESCPDELLLFFHHVPYTHVLHSGKSLIQHVYDSHYQGAREAARFVDRWRALKGQIDEQRFEEVLDRLEYQAGHAQVWRDAICSYFMKRSGIADDRGRVGNHPNRIEAEAMTLDGYETVEVAPWETASGGQAAHCIADDDRGSVSYEYEGEPGWFTVSIWHFDQNNGESQYKLLVNDQTVDRWTANVNLPDTQPSGHTNTRHKSPPLALRPGDTIRIAAETDGGERAAIDYVEIDPAGG